MGPLHWGQSQLGLVCGARMLVFLLAQVWNRVRQSRVAVSKETEVADAYETFGEQMQEEAAQELIER